MARRIRFGRYTVHSLLKANLCRAVGASLAALFALIPTGLLVASAAGTDVIPVRIVPSADPVDAAMPFQLTAWTSSAEPVTSYNWTNDLGGSTDTAVWDLDVDVPGNLTVTVKVSNAAGDQGAATLTLPVRPALSVTVSSPLAQVDAGLPAPFFIAVAGGVPPLTVNWTPASGGTPGSATWPVDGNYSEELNFTRPGPGWILVHATDALAQSTNVDDLLTEVVNPGSLVLTTNGTVGEVGWRIGIAVAVNQGAPPFRWSLSSSLPLSSSANPAGFFPTDGMYRWNVSFAFPGVALLNLTAVDAIGAPLAASAAVVVEPPLTIQIIPPGVEPSSPFQVSTNITGGLPPYAYQFRLSDGESSNGILASPGSALAEFNPPPNAGYSLEVRVTDTLGQSSNSTEFLRVNGLTPAVSDPPSIVWASYGSTGGLVVVGLVLSFYAYRRLRRRPEPPAASERSALPTVRQLMRQSQIIDRETLLLLCEEAGETPEAAQAALQVLIRTEEVSTEPGPANDEVLRWRGSGRLAGPEEGSP